MSDKMRIWERFLEVIMIAHVGREMTPTYALSHPSVSKWIGKHIVATVGVIDGDPMSAALDRLVEVGAMEVITTGSEPIYRFTREAVDAICEATVGGGVAGSKDCPNWVCDELAARGFVNVGTWMRRE